MNPISRSRERLRELLGDKWCLVWTPEGFDLKQPLGWVCTLSPGHEGDHEARHVGTGELFATWP